MKKSLSIIVFLSLSLGGFFGFTEAQNFDTTFDATNLTTIKSIYRVNHVMEDLPFIVKKVSHLLIAKADASHAAAQPEIVYEMDNSKISNVLQESATFDEFFHKIRMDVLQFLISQGYKDFNDQPYGKDGNGAITAKSGDFQVLKSISESDSLDMFLKDKLAGFKDDFDDIKDYTNYLDFKKIDISADEYRQLGKLYLFRNEQDLRDLGYELISWKTRTNTDMDYRRHNISTAFYNIGNVRLIMPDETFSLTSAFHYSAADGGRPFVAGYATMGGGVKLIYGGGLCGVATAFYQGTLTNLGLSLVEYKAHSIYYRNLYEAEINGVIITEPGLDATVYLSDIDLQSKNIRNYPIIVVFDYDGKIGTQEQVFTLSMAQDRGSFEYVGTYRKGGSRCFTRKVNGVDRTNCYSKVTNF